ncbi:MAG TPA: toxic anion resistance protein [Clostridiaceae bacterium]|nr:toxic anion resistance protein [Clostridiaceae bacterium]
MATNISLNDLLDGQKSANKLAGPKDSQQEIALIQHELQTITPEDRTKIDQIKQNLDLRNNQQMVQYASGAQQNLTTFAETILNKIKTKDAGAVGDMMNDLLTNVESLEIAELGQDDGLLSRIFNPLSKRFKKFIQKYNSVENNINRIEIELDKAKMMMLKDIALYDQLYEQNLQYFKDLQYYIWAGEEVISEMRTITLPRLHQEAESSGDPMAVQVVNDFAQTVDRFEKKVHDLKLSKTISIQTAPQIRLIQNNDKLLVEKIQTAIINTIPLWKSQIVIALGLQNQQRVLEMQKAVSETTNDLLKKNSEMLRQNSIEVARESERGIVEIETLQKVNNDLIEVINETLRIQEEGRARRSQAEASLIQIENQLKEGLMAAGERRIHPSQQTTI